MEHKAIPLHKEHTAWPKCVVKNSNAPSSAKLTPTKGTEQSFYLDQPCKARVAYVANPIPSLTKIVNADSFKQK